MIPEGREGGLGILHTHCPAANNSGASEQSCHLPQTQKFVANTGCPLKSCTFF